MIGAHALARNRLMCVILLDRLAVLGRGESLGNQQHHGEDQDVDDDGQNDRWIEPPMLVINPCEQQVPHPAGEFIERKEQHHRRALAAARGRADLQIEQRRCPQRTHKTKQHGGIQCADCIVDKQKRNRLHHPN